MFRTMDARFSRAKFQSKSKNIVLSVTSVQRTGTGFVKKSAEVRQKTPLVLHIRWFLVLKKRRVDSQELWSSTAVGYFIDGS